MTVKRALRWTGLLLGVVAIGLSGSLIVLLIKPKLLEGYAQGVVERSLGYAFTTRAIDVSLVPAQLVLRDFSLLNPSSPTESQLLWADEVTVTVELSKLLGSEPDYLSGTAEGIRVNYVDDGGRSNWKRELPAMDVPVERETEPGAAAKPFYLHTEFPLNTIDLRDAIIEVQTPGRQTTAEIDTISIRREDRNVLGELIGSLDDRDLKGNFTLRLPSDPHHYVETMVAASTAGVELRFSADLLLAQIGESLSDGLLWGSTFTADLDVSDGAELAHWIGNRGVEVDSSSLRSEGTIGEVLSASLVGDVALRRGTFGVNAEVAAAVDTPHRLSIKGGSQGMGATVHVDGEIDLNALIRSQGTIEASVADLSSLIPDGNAPIATLSDLSLVSTFGGGNQRRISTQLRGQLQGKLLHLSVDADPVTTDDSKAVTAFDVDAKGGYADAVLTATGQLPSRILSRPWEVAVRLDVPTKASLLPWVEFSTDEYLPLNVAANIVQADSRISADAISISAGENAMQGGVSYDVDVGALDVELREVGLDISPLLATPPDRTKQAAQRDRNDATGDDRTANSVAAVELPAIELPAWLSSIDVEIDAREIVAQQHRVNGARAALTIKNGELRLDPFEGSYTYVREGASPITSPVSLTAVVAGLAKDGGAPASVVVDGQLGSMKVEADTRFAHSSLAEVTGTVDISVEDAELLSAIANRDLSILAPAALGVDLKFETESLTIDPISITVAGDTITGRGEITPGADVPEFSLELSAESLDVDRLRAMAATQDDTSSKAGTSLLSDEPIDWAWLDSGQGRIGLNLANFTLNQTAFTNLEIGAQLTSGRLTVDTFKADLASGGISGQASIARDADLVDISLDLHAIRLTPADLGQPDKGIIDGGNTDIAIDLSARGASSADLAAALNGEIVIEIEQAKIRNTLFELFGSDLFLEALSMLNPFAEEETFTRLECAAIRAVAEEGVLRSLDQIIVETSKMKIIGTGEVDLESEEIAMGFKPVAKEGVGISVGKLVNVMGVGGTLSEPKIEADIAGIAGSAARIGAALSTGGLSLLAEGLFDRTTESRYACDAIFDQHVESIPEGIQNSENQND